MINVEHLTKKYNDLTAVDDLSFTISEKQVVGLLGPNGAGKSTTMRMLTGYLAPSSGRVLIDGKDLQAQPLEARRRIGYLPELPPLYPDFTVREHLKFVCSLRGVDAGAESAEIARVCEALNITDVNGRMIRKLSKGYRQRVGFAASLIGRPSFLILDEPTVGLDPAQIYEIRSLIERLSGEMSILISSHILSEISSVCDSLLILRRGRLVAKGTKEQIERAMRGETRIELVAKGDMSRLRTLVQAAVPSAKAAWEPADGGAVRCILICPAALDPRAQLFRAFADRKNDTTLLTMRPLDKSLEDIYLEIVQS